MQGLVERTKNEKRRAEFQAELECPPFPDALSYLWGAFLRLANRRSSNGFGVNPISWADIEAFTRLSGSHLSPWEVEIIEMLDNLYRIEQAKSGVESQNG